MAPLAIAAVLWLAPTLIASAPATPVVRQARPRRCRCLEGVGPAAAHFRLDVDRRRRGGIRRCSPGWSAAPTLIARAAPTPTVEPSAGLPSAVAESSVAQGMNEQRAGRHDRAARSDRRGLARCKSTFTAAAAATASGAARRSWRVGTCDRRRQPARRLPETHRVRRSRC